MLNKKIINNLFGKDIINYIVLIFIAIQFAFYYFIKSNLYSIKVILIFLNIFLIYISLFNAKKREELYNRKMKIYITEYYSLLSLISLFVYEIVDLINSFTKFNGFIFYTGFMYFIYSVCSVQ